MGVTLPQNLMRELESERERRWKAEQATKKLVDHIKQLQIKGQSAHWTLYVLPWGWLFNVTFYIKGNIDCNAKH